MSTPNNTPYKVEQRDLAKRAKHQPLSESWYRAQGFHIIAKTAPKKRKIAQYKKR